VVIGNGLLPSAEHLEDVRACVKRLCIVGAQFKGALDIRQSLRGLASLKVGPSAVVIGLGIFRVELNADLYPPSNPYGRQSQFSVVAGPCNHRHLYSIAFGSKRMSAG
jgi:hypothetical protein